MANIKSQIKRNRQTERLRQRNKSTRSALKTQIKTFEELAEAGDKTKAEEVFRETVRAIDKAAAAGIIHKNTASTRKSRLAKRLSN